MTGSSDTFSSALSSALSYALSTLISERRTAKSLEVIYQGNSVFVWLPAGIGKAFVTKISHSRLSTTSSTSASHDHCLISNQIFSVVGGLWFLFDS